MLVWLLSKVISRGVVRAVARTFLCARAFQGCQSAAVPAVTTPQRPTRTHPHTTHNTTLNSTGAAKLHPSARRIHHQPRTCCVYSAAFAGFFKHERHPRILHPSASLEQPPLSNQEQYVHQPPALLDG
jgi:hypothetical protein